MSQVSTYPGNTHFGLLKNSYSDISVQKSRFFALNPFFDPPFSHSSLVHSVYSYRVHCFSNFMLLFKLWKQWITINTSEGVLAENESDLVEFTVSQTSSITSRWYNSSHLKRGWVIPARSVCCFWVRWVPGTILPPLPEKLLRARLRRRLLQQGLECCQGAVGWWGSQGQAQPPILLFGTW